MADTTTMIPFNTETSAWSPTLGAFAGSLFGNFFWGNGGFWGNNRYGTDATAAGLVSNANQNANDAVIIDDLSRITEQLGNVNTTLLNSQSQQNLAMSQGFCNCNDAVKDANIALNGTINDGFSRLARDINTGMSDVTKTVIQENNNVGLQLNNSFARATRDIATGFAGLDKSVMGSTMGLTQSINNGVNNVVNAVNANGTQARFDTMAGFNNLQQAVSSTGCGIQTALREGFGGLALENCKNTGMLVNEIAKEGCATRALINENYINDLQTKLCDAKAKISSLESQQYTGNALAAQSAVFDNKLTTAVATIISALKTTTA